jgi:hypothetical protein
MRDCVARKFILQIICWKFAKIKHLRGPSGERRKAMGVSYSVAQYHRFKDLAFATQLSRGSREVIEELGALVRKHRLQSAIAVRLIHTHFNMKANECILMELDEDGICGEPGRWDETLVPSAFCFSGDGCGQIEILEGLKGATGRELAQTQWETLERVPEFIKEARTVVAQYGVESLYGFTLRFYSSEIDLEQGLYMEKTDYKKRKSLATRIERAELCDEASWSPTVWSFDGTEMVVEVACITAGEEGCAAPPPP